jgi:hypothetical protein
MNKSQCNEDRETKAVITQNILLVDFVKKRGNIETPDLNLNLSLTRYMNI